MKRKTRVFMASILAAAGFSLVAGDSQAAFHLFDDKLRVKGSIYEFMMYRTKFADGERQYRDTEWGLMRTKGTLELLYKAVEQENLQVNLFSFLQYWREKVPDFDQEYHDSMTRDNRKRYQGPSYDQDDWINEMYADIYSGKWNIRLGKQIVFWSEVEMVRTVDRINQLDLRYTTPGIDPWDEMKLGLWMMRGFYNSDLPGQLVFEWIWIPGDFEGVRTPREGTSMGASPNPPPVSNPDLQPLAYGLGAGINEQWRKSQPSFTLSNSQFAFRIRGNSEVALLGDYYLLDWTLSYYHGMNNTPVPKSGEIATINAYSNQLALARVFGQVNGQPVTGYRDLPQVTGDWWEYKFFDVIGTSCQTYVPKLGSVVRGEVSYEIGLPEIKSDPDDKPSYMSQITGTTERDVVNVGVTIDKPLKSTWLSQRWGASGVFDCTLGWFGQWRLGNVSRIRRTFAHQDKSQTNFTLTLRTRLKHNSIWPTFRTLYNTRNWGYCVWAVRYTPGKHMRYELGYIYFYAKNQWDFREAYAENKDSIYFRIGYEF